jgi:hypothetical protein
VRLPNLRFTAVEGIPIVLFFAIVALLVVVAISVTVFIVMREERQEVRGSFPLIHTRPPVAQAERSELHHRRPYVKTRPDAPVAQAPAARQVPLDNHVVATNHAPVVSQVTVPSQLAAASLSRQNEVEVAIATSEEPESSPTVRFRRPVEFAVQLLPGRLEVVSGDTHHKEIRLVGVQGEPPEVILGRDLMEHPGHVALRSATVSRRHARLAYADGAWKVANLSQTNPVVVNDEALSAHQGERTLADGDCLELGEVVLRFHAQ